MSVKEFAEKYIRAYDEAFLTGNCDALEKLEDPDVVHHNVGSGGERVGWEAQKQHLLEVWHTLSGRRREWQYLTGEGNYFALSLKERGMFTGRAPDWPQPTGKEVTNNHLFLFHLNNKGKIAEAWFLGIWTGRT